MDDIAQIIDQCTSGVADGLSAAVADVVDSGIAISDRRKTLVTGATIQALLGPKLAELVKGLGADIERKTAERFQAALDHPRYGREPIIDELENAEVAFNEAVLAAQRDGSLANIVAVMLAGIRLSAVTTVVGEACVVPPIVDGGKGRTGPKQRRRKITADDVPSQIKELVCRAAFDASEDDAAIAELGELRGTTVDRGGIVTKIVALAQLEGGRKFVNEIATRIKKASPDSAKLTDVVVPDRKTLTGAASTARVVPIASEPKPDETGVSPSSQIATTVVPGPQSEKALDPVTSAALHPVAIAAAGTPHNFEGPLHRDRADEKAMPEFLAWLETQRPSFTRLLDELADGTIVRRMTMNVPAVNTRFEGAGRHPSIQAKLRAMMRKAAEGQGQL